MSSAPNRPHFITGQGPARWPSSRLSLAGQRGLARLFSWGGTLLRFTMYYCTTHDCHRCTPACPRTASIHKLVAQPQLEKCVTHQMGKFHWRPGASLSVRSSAIGGTSTVCITMLFVVYFDNAKATLVYPNCTCLCWSCFFLVGSLGIRCLCGHILSAINGYSKLATCKQKPYSAWTHP